MSNQQSRQYQNHLAQSHQPNQRLRKRNCLNLEAREYAGIEQHIFQAEELVRAKQAQFEDPSIASNASQLVTVQAELEAAQKALEILYARWAELEEKSS